MQNYLVLFYGPSCSGKSTICNLLIPKYPWSMHIKTDTIKRFIIWYNPINHVVLARNMTIWLAESAMKENLSLFVEAHLDSKHINTYKELCNHYNYRLITLWFEADYNVLMQRFQERISSIQQQRKKIYANQDIEKFKERYKTYLWDKQLIEFDKIFDTNINTIDEILLSIQDIIIHTP